MDKIINAEKSKDFVCYASSELVESRKILNVSYLAGTYGFGGGYGFLGFKLDKVHGRPREWLVCTLFGAHEWFTIGNRWLAAHPAQYSEQVPLMGYGFQRDQRGRLLPTGKDWDYFKPMIIGQKLKKFDCEKRWCKLVISDVVLEIVEDYHKRPIYYGSKEWRQLEPEDDLQRAWIIAKDDYLLI